MTAGTNVTVSGVYCELLHLPIDAESLCMPTRLRRNAFCALKQFCMCVPPGHDSQSRRSFQMMTAMTGHCTRLAHVPSSAQVIAVGASWDSLWALMAVLCCPAQTDQPLAANLEALGSHPVHTPVHALSAAQILSRLHDEWGRSAANSIVETS